MPVFPFVFGGACRRANDHVQETGDMPARADAPARASGALPRQRESGATRLRVQNPANRLWQDRRDRDGNTALHRALLAGDERAVDRQLRNGGNPNLATRDGKTPLAMAIAAGEAGLPMVARLLGDPRIDPNQGFPLYHAVRGHHLRVTELLLAHPRTDRSGTPTREVAWERALQAADTEILRAFHNAGENLNVPRQDGNLPLHRAMLKGKPKQVRALLAAGADINQPNVEGKTALHLVAMLDDLQNALRLLRQYPPAIVQQLINPPLLPAQNIPLAMPPIPPAAPIEEPRALPQPEALAAGQDHAVDATEPMVQRLRLERRDALPHGEMQQRLREFHEPNRLAVIDALFNVNEKNIDVTDRSGNTPLHYAINAGNVQVANRLIEAGATIDPARPSSLHAMHRFAREGNEDILKILIKAGVDVNQPAADGSTALENALEFAHSDVEAARILIATGARITPEKQIAINGLTFAAKTNQVDIAQALLAAGVDLNARNSQGKTALHNAAQADSLETLELLLKEPGLDVTIKFQNATAFDLAMKAINTEAAVRIFRHPDADPNAAWWNYEFPAIRTILLQRAGTDGIDSKDEYLRLLTFCADHRPRIGQPDLAMSAITNSHIGTKLNEEPSRSASKGLARYRLALAFEQQLQASGAYVLPFHQQVATELLQTDSEAKDFAIGQAWIPRSELEDMAKAEVYYAGREANILLERDMADIAARRIDANVYQRGVADLNLQALTLLQERDDSRLPKLTEAESRAMALALIAPKGALAAAAARIADILSELTPDDTDLIRRLSDPTKETIATWISQQPAADREVLTQAWELRLARFGLEHALRQTEPVNEDRLQIAAPEVIRLLIADNASRPELQDNLNAAFIKGLADISNRPCARGCVVRLLATQFGVKPELMVGAPDLKTLPAELNAIAMRVNDRVNIELERGIAEDCKEDEFAALRNNAPTIKHDRFAHTAKMLLLLRGLPADSVQEHIAAIKEGFKQDMY